MVSMSFQYFWCIACSSQLAEGLDSKSWFKSNFLIPLLCAPDTLYTPLLLHSAHCLLAAYISLPDGSPAQGHTLWLISPLVFPAPSTMPNPGRREVYTRCIKLQVIYLELSTHFPKEMHDKWEWKRYVSNQPTKVYLNFLVVYPEY